MAIVLGAGLKDGTLSPVFKERHAVNLIQDGQVDYLILTSRVSEGEEVSDSQAASNYAQALGVDENKIHLEERSTLTYYNIVYAKGIIL
ncbi:MAG: uncharacterized SAM-binding protein YcdF (DUF218 family) [Chitinophagales bacterium]